MPLTVAFLQARKCFAKVEPEADCLVWQEQSYDFFMTKEKNALF